jgi:hypothetical protein
MRKRHRAANAQMHFQAGHAPRPQDLPPANHGPGRAEAHDPTHGRAVAAQVLEQNVPAMVASLLRDEQLALRGMRKVLVHAAANRHRSELANARRGPFAKGKPHRKGTWTTALAVANQQRDQGARGHGPRTVLTAMLDHGVLRQVASGAKRRTAGRTPRLPWTD